MQIDSSNLINTTLVNNKVSPDDIRNQDLKKACDDFESFFLRQFMDISLQSTDIAGKGAGSDIIKGMYSEAMASNSNGTVGISSMLYDFLTKNNK